VSKYQQYSRLLALMFKTTHVAATLKWVWSWLLLAFPGKSRTQGTLRLWKDFRDMI